MADYNYTPLLTTKLLDTAGNSLIKRDISEKILDLDSLSYPLTAIIKSKYLKNKVGGVSAPATNYKFEVMYSPTHSLTTTVQTTPTNPTTDTTIAVADSTVFVVDMVVLEVDVNELMLVTAVDHSAGTITVTRGFADTTAGSIAAGHKLFPLGTAKAEAGDFGTGRMINLEIDYNYTQIFETPVETSLRATVIAAYGDDPSRWERTRRDSAITHQIDMERAFIWGKKSETTTSNGIRTTTDGFINLIDSGNLWDVGGALTKADLDDYLADVFNYTNARRVKFAFCNNKFLSVFNTLMDGYIRIGQSEKLFGWSYTHYKGYYGDLYLFPHRLLTEYSSNGYALVVDPDYINYKPLKGFDTSVIRLDPASYKAYKIGEVIYTDAGLELLYPQAHGVIKGITG